MSVSASFLKLFDFGDIWCASTYFDYADSHGMQHFLEVSYFH